MAEEATIVLETHIYSIPTTIPSPPWTRSFHLRLTPSTATKAQILSLVRDSMTRLGRADPVVEGQITLYWTSRNGQVVSIPGGSGVNGASTAMATVTMPVWQQQPPQLMTFNIGYPALIQPQPQPQPQMTMTMDPPMPMAMTYSGGVNYLHSYGNPAAQQPMMFPPPCAAIVPVGQQTWIMGSPLQLGFVNVNVPTFDTGGGGGIGAGRPVVSDVVRETRLDGIAEAALGGMLEWVCGPTGLKLIVVVDAEGRDVVPVVVAAPAAVVAEPPPVAASSTPSSPAVATPVAPGSPASPAESVPATPATS
ncbi:hypothetical protein BDP55DRAFT_629579 [Colletotrichum godetiae]|uniref:Uncharacterized protein n=1 Tax=Colletotrichum godetiae TaxID=1209918 RepID=A0AAJ0AT47_9PEZI|nr:uncharacterized protein BDP55DRAFT_629579 [Colletotrichum godetiae]KAK1688471.1 hypothetical protein BDP55DRAFT_629579 [Colletotrichum godetiae]